MQLVAGCDGWVNASPHLEDRVFELEEVQEFIRREPAFLYHGFHTGTEKPPHAVPVEVRLDLTLEDAYRHGKQRLQVLAPRCTS